MKYRLLLVLLFITALVLCELPLTYRELAYSQTSPTMNEILSKTFTRVQTTPVLPHGSSGAWDSYNIGGSCIIDDGAQLIMYHLGSGPVYGGAGGRATAPRTEPPISWAKYAGNPILVASSSGWESGCTLRFGSVVKAGSSYYMYYSTEQNGALGKRATVGLAISTDGVNFVKYASNPILLPDVFIGDYHCAIPMVINSGGAYYMYYTSSTVNNFWTPNQYRVASSSDGIHWTKGGVIVSTGPGWDSRYLEQCKVYQASDGIILTYEGYSGSQWCIGAATSSNPLGPFTKWSGNPIFRPSGVPGTFDQYHVATPYFYRMSQKVYLFYQGGDSSSYDMASWNIGLAAISIESDGPETGTLKVFASYDGAYVSASVTATGPQTVTGQTTDSGITFTVLAGTYTITGTYPLGSAVPQYATVPSGGSAPNVYLNFGGVTPPPVPELLFQFIFIIGTVATVGGLVFFARRKSGGLHFSSRRRVKHKWRLS